MPPIDDLTKHRDRDLILNLKVLSFEHMATGTTVIASSVVKAKNRIDMWVLYLKDDPGLR